MVTSVMIMNLTPGSYDVFTMAPFKVKSPKSLFALWQFFIGEDIYQLLNSISVRSGPMFSSRMAHNEVP